MIALLSLTGPIFALILLGFLAVSKQVIAKEGIMAFGRFLVSFAIPAALFKALSERNINEIFHADYLLAYSIASLVPFAFLFFISRVVQKRGLDHSAIIAMGGSFSNTLMIGYPIIYQLFGDKALVPFALTLIVENLLMMPLVLALAELNNNKGGHFLKTVWQTFLQLLKTPIILGIILGLFASLLSLPIPGPVARIVDMLAATVAALALFTVGGNLAGIRFQGMALDLSLIGGTKLLLHPAAIILCLSLMPDMDPVLTSVAIILASMPMFGVYSAIGARYNLGGLCAAALVPTTLLSFITINLAIWYTGN